MYVYVHVQERIFCATDTLVIRSSKTIANHYCFMPQHVCCKACICVCVCVRVCYHSDVIFKAKARHLWTENSELAWSAIDNHVQSDFEVLALAACTEGLLNKASHRIHSILLLWR